jgi:hypothetical protein
MGESEKNGLKFDLFALVRCACESGIVYSSNGKIERQNLTMRMSMRRCTRLTNAFSRSLDNHIHSINLFYMWYNFARSTRPCGLLRRRKRASGGMFGRLGKS